MKAHTNGFKNQIKTMGRELDSKIIYTINGVTTTLTVEDVNSVTPSFNGGILKSVMKQLEIDSNIDIPVGTTLSYQFGIKVSGTYEYLNYGNYIVYSSEKQEDTYSYKIICYDKMLYSMVQNDDLGITYPITIRDYIGAICTKLGLVFANSSGTFTNYNQEIPEELYEGLEYTYRDILDDLAEVTGSTICINNSDELEVRYITETNDTIDEEFFKNINVNFGEETKAINTIVLSRSADSDKISLSNPTTILDEDKVAITITDNQIMNQNNRGNYLQGLLDRLYGFQYYLNDFSSTGICYYELCDRYSVSIGDNTYSCIMLNDEVLVTQGLEENIYTEKMEESDTDYKTTDDDDRKINQTWIIVNKQIGQIEALTSKVSVVDNMYTKEQVNDLIQTAEEGITNIFKTTGGNNLLRNSALYFKENGTNYDYWVGVANKIIYAEAQSNTAISLQNGSFKQSLFVANGNYTISFKYNQINPLGTSYVIINGETITLEENGEITKTIEITTNSFEIEFVCDLDDSYIIYDLMLNNGTEASSWSQSQNEIHTNTVNISKGVTVEATENDTIANLGADGLKVTNKNTNNVVLKATDTGIETTNIDSDSGVIGGVSMKKVDNQSWMVGV